MFGDKLHAAHTKLASLVALIAATGFKIEAADVTKADWAPPSADAFKAHLSTQRDAAVVEATQGLNAKISLATAEASVFRFGLTAAGVKLGDFKADDFTAAEGQTLADSAGALAVKSAVETAIAARAAKQIAASGHPNALELPAGGDAAPAAKTSKELMTEFQAITDSVKRAEFYAKHEAKLLN